MIHAALQGKERRPWKQNTHKIYLKKGTQQCTEGVIKRKKLYVPSQGTA
jgi:hypothetical protein